MDESNNPCDEDLENGDVNCTVENGSYAETSFSTAVERRKLKAELETCRQESYFLRRKFELQEVMLKDLQAINESLERELSKKSSTKDNALRELEEQHRASRERYDERITSLETALAEKVSQNEELQELLAKQREEAAAAVASEPSIITENDTAAFEQQVEELMLRLEEELHLRQEAENTLHDLKARFTELQNVLEATREHVREKSEALEGAREELALLRTELNTPKPSLDDGSSKGNSLFAEVEDRRKQTVDKFAALKNKYMEAKQMCKTKMDEIKMLRAERAATLKKWENDFVGNQADNKELIDKYKSRIADLENKLRAEIKKNGESQESVKVDPSYEFFQSLLTSKKREIENLQIKIEDLSTKLLIKEEAKLNTEKEMRFWRYKASSLEAQTILSKMESKYGTKDVQEEEPDTPTSIKSGEADEGNLHSLIDSNKAISVKLAKDNSQDSLNTEIVAPKKSLKFSENTKDNASNMKKTKNRDYPILFIPS